MARFYRLWVKYPPVHNTDLYAQLPADFAGGEHGTLCLNYDAEVWFAPPDGYSGPLAKRFLGAASGKLAEDFAGTQSYLYDGDVVVGITSVSVFKVVNFHGAIGVNPRLARATRNAVANRSRSAIAPTSGQNRRATRTTRT